MLFLTYPRRIVSGCITLLTICSAASAPAAMDPAFELDPAALAGINASPRPATRAEKRTGKVRVPRAKGAGTVHGTAHTVRAGENLYRILMRNYGMSNDEAEACIEQIRRENNISDIRRLKVGQKIIIPTVRRGREGAVAVARRTRGAEVQPQLSGDDSAVVTHQLRLEPTHDSQLDQEALLRVEELWNKLVPQISTAQKPLSFQSPAFSLALDPQRYPVFSAMDGARILVDRNASIPPLVRSLIAEKDPSVRFVSEPPSQHRQFLAAMLAAGGFYSVEDNFDMEFGVDPKLKVHADFKVETNPESLIRQEVFLLNSGRNSLPPQLTTFLKAEGFTAYEPFASPQPVISRPAPRPVFQITKGKQPEMVDAILGSLGVAYDTDRRVDVFSSDDNGISLSVRAERFFEHDGQRCVVAGFDGDPVTYTLFRILETKGYRVVMLEGGDGFRNVAEKLLTAMRLPAYYARHTMWPENGSNYSLQISGFRLDGAAVPGGSLFLTDLPLDRINRDLLAENGYEVQDK